LAAELFRPMGSDGVYARTGIYEHVIDQLGAFITQQRDEGVEVFRFPPVMSRQQLERAGYLGSFPNLLGCVSALHGTEQQIRVAADRFKTGNDWTASLAPTDLVLTPAACYPMYPIAARRGPVPAGGLQFDVACDCFRREPSREIDRFQSFRMREFVRIGTGDEIMEYRERWIVRAKQMSDALGLPWSVAPASDPFFGRTGQVMAVAQLQQELKFELLVPVRSSEQLTACMSFNYHRDHFGITWEIRGAAGDPAHTGCVAFGMDRLAVALFSIHGLDLQAWPKGVRSALML